MNTTAWALAAALSLALPGTAAAATAGATTPARKPAPPRAPAKKAVKALPAASDEQKDAAAQAHLGAYACEFDQTVTVAPNPLAPGYLDVTHLKKTWVMKPTLSSTGALRLEESSGPMLMIQIANKSMLMDAHAGRRVVDGCQHEKQREFERTLQGSDNAGTLLKP